MQEEDIERVIKVLVIGNGSVGKTSMIRRFCKGIYTDEYKKTIGVDFLEKAQFVDTLQEEVKFMLWDTAGQEEFDAITRGYFRGAGAAVIAFSTPDRASFDAVEAWKAKADLECGDIALCLVQNKVDLIDDASMTPQEVEAMARKLNIKLYRTCVKENVNVTEVFVYLAELHDKKLASGRLGQPINIPVPEAAASSSAGAAQPAAPVTPVAPAANPGWGGPTSSAAAPEAPKPAAPLPANYPPTVDIGPSKMRTKGKKNLKDKLSACSII